MDHTLLQAWATRLHAAAQRSPILGRLSPTDIDHFADESGNRRAVDRPILCRHLSVSPGPTPARVIERRDDVTLWWALFDPQIDPETLISPVANLTRDTITLAAPVISLPADTIEVFTQAQLSALHALWHLAAARSRTAWRDRCLAAAAWFIENLQPDNATNHPWAIHVFITLAAENPVLAPNAMLYAQTLLHNSQVHLGYPDAFSALLLADAAAALKSQASNLKSEI